MRSEVSEVDRPLSVAFAFVALFATALSLWLAAIVGIARSGLGTPVQALLAGPLVLAASAFSPFLLPRAWRLRFESQPAWAACLILGVWLSPVLSLAVGVWIALLYPVAAPLGLLRALPALRALSRAELLLLALAPPVVALYVFSLVHVSPFAHVLSPEQALLGNLNVDTSLHTTLSHLIYRQGQASIGLDGLVPMRYHVGSHTWLAGLAALGGVQPNLAYPLGQICVAVPMLYAGLYWATVCIAKSSRAVALQVLSATLLVWVFDRIGWTSYYISESFTFGLAALLLLLPLLIDLVETPRRSPGSDALRLGALLGGALILSAMKLSVGFAYSAALGYALLRLFRFSWRSVTALSLLGIVTLVALHYFQARTGLPLSEVFSPLHFYRETKMGIFFDPTKAHSSLVLPALYLLLALWERLRGEVPPPPQEGRLTTEIFAFTTLAAHLPGLLLLMWNATAWWFQNVPQWMAIPLLLARFGPPLTRRLPPRVLAVALSLGLALLAAMPIRRLPYRFSPVARELVRESSAIDGRKREVRGYLVRRYLGESLLQRGTLFDPGIRAAVQSNPIARASRWISDWAADHEYSRVAVFVPPRNALFWSPDGTPPNTRRCLRRPFVLPALTGVPMLMGLPRGCPNFPYLKGYGHGDYGPEARTRVLSDDALCRHAREREVTRVLVLESLERADENRTLDCS